MGKIWKPYRPHPMKLTVGLVRHVDYLRWGDSACSPDRSLLRLSSMSRFRWFKCHRCDRSRTPHLKWVYVLNNRIHMSSNFRMLSTLKRLMMAELGPVRALRPNLVLLKLTTHITTSQRRNLLDGSVSGNERCGWNSDKSLRVATFLPHPCTPRSRMIDYASRPYKTSDVRPNLVIPPMQWYRIACRIRSQSPPGDVGPNHHSLRVRPGRSSWSRCEPRRRRRARRARPDRRRRHRPADSCPGHRSPARRGTES